MQIIQGSVEGHGAGKAWASPVALLTVESEVHGELDDVVRTVAGLEPEPQLLDLCARTSSQRLVLCLHLRLHLLQSLPLLRSLCPLLFQLLLLEPRLFIRRGLPRRLFLRQPRRLHFRPLPRLLLCKLLLALPLDRLQARLLCCSFRLCNRRKPLLLLLA